MTEYVLVKTEKSKMAPHIFLNDQLKLALLEHAEKLQQVPNATTTIRITSKVIANGHLLPLRYEADVRVSWIYENQVEHHSFSTIVDDVESLLDSPECVEITKAEIVWETDHFERRSSLKKQPPRSAMNFSNQMRITDFFKVSENHS